LALTFRSAIQSRRRAGFVRIASLLASVALLILPAVFRLDGRPHSNWQQLLGRFHPLIVHLPIGLILLVPVLEIAGAARPALREAADFVLSLSVFACLGAVATGYLLAYGSGSAGAGVNRHLWGGIALAIAVLLGALVRPLWASGQLQGLSHSIYPAVLGCVLLLLAWTAHQGSSLTHSDNYLTEFMPGPLKHWRLPWTTQPTVVPPDSFYATHISAVLDANCVACHGESKVKGGLRLDSYDALMRGGREGAIVIAGQPDRSLLLRRVTLPPNHKQFMPGEGKPPLKPEEIEMIRAWIAQGASPIATTISGMR
jgi:uncharacterized membrane protein/mono/diheme cytochrome c family protein